METKPKILDLFCGAGGSAMGLYRAGFDVVGVDIKSQPHYPFPFIQGDAIDIEFSGFDAYWASPPCQAYVDRNCKGDNSHPKLIELTRELLLATGKPFVIENVFKAPLKATLMLCGTMFGLRIIRHRYFELNWSGPMSPYTCNHNGTVAGGDYIAIYSGGFHTPTLPGGFRPFAKEQDIDTWSQAMGIDWMMHKWELKEAIPPAYSEFIGRCLLKVIL